MRSPSGTIAGIAAALAAGMGVGRFVYTPILPLMQAQAGMSAELAAGLATANYVGYLVGAVAGIVVPRLASSRWAMRVSLIVVTASLALMPLTRSPEVWGALRTIGGAGSAVVFVVAMTALVEVQRGPSGHLAGWGVGGVGAGIALSGAALLGLQDDGTWGLAWFAGAVLSVILTVVAWSVRIPGPVGDARPMPKDSGGWWFLALLASYTLEGIGYIIAGTFLVAAVGTTGPHWLGSGVWLVVGVAAAVSPRLWFGLSRRWSRTSLLLVALVAQAVGIALPAVFGGVAAALLGAILFGGTFLAIAALSASIGGHLRPGRAVPILTTGYSIGQILGPVVVTPFVGSGYRTALAIGSGVVVLAAGAAAVLRNSLSARSGVVDGMKSPVGYSSRLRDQAEPRTTGRPSRH